MRSGMQQRSCARPSSFTSLTLPFRNLGLRRTLLGETIYLDVSRPLTADSTVPTATYGPGFTAIMKIEETMFVAQALNGSDAGCGLTGTAT